MILSLHFVYSPAILLYIINNIMLLKRSIIAKSTVCADIFNNMLHRPLYSLLRTKGVESKEHLLRIRVQAYSMIICLRSLLCNTTALRMWIGLFSTCNVSAHAGLTSSLGHCIWTYLLMVFCALRAPNTFFVFHFSDPLSIIIRKVDLAFFEFSPYIEIILFCYSILRYCYENHLNR